METQQQNRLILLQMLLVEVQFVVNQKQLWCVCVFVLPADAALPGQSVTGRSWRCLIGVVEIRTFQVQNHLRNKNKHTNGSGDFLDALLCKDKAGTVVFSKQ